MLVISIKTFLILIHPFQDITDFYSNDWFKKKIIIKICNVVFFNKNKPRLILALFIKVQKTSTYIGGWLWGNDDVMFKVGMKKSWRLLIRWVGGTKNGQKKHAYVIVEWSLSSSS